MPGNMTYRELEKAFVEGGDKSGLTTIKAALKKPPTQRRIEPEDVTEEYLRNATPGVGKITYEDGYKIDKHKEEMKIAQWFLRTFGGDIRLLSEENATNVKTPDSVWKEKLWEYKTAVSINAADKRLQDGLKQIK